MPNASPGFERNPSKIITIVPYAGTVTIKAGGVVIAKSAKAKVLNEEPLPAVFYVPFKDIKFSSLTKETTSTHCPYKGNASHWTVKPLGDKGKDAMWAYEAPYDEMLAIKDHGAFYAGRVEIETEILDAVPA